jgi:glucokinase
MMLVGDIGGTKVHLAIYDGDRCVKEEKFKSRHFHGLSEILQKFLDRKIDAACFAIAGPIKEQTCKITNLNWTIDASELKKHHSIREVHLLNDLEAAARGVQMLKSKELVTLNEGKKQKGNRAVIAAGTGLGIGGLFWDGNYHHAFGTEAGHVDFAPKDLQERELWDYLHKKYGHVSMERVVSGPGLEHLYWFLVEKNKIANVLEGEEIPKLIVERGDLSPICEEALNWFASLYASAAGNVALQYMAVNGLYIGGGIAPKILKYLQRKEFMLAFSNKGRFQELLLDIPVHVVLNENLPLLGALSYCKAD